MRECELPLRAQAAREDPVYGALVAVGVVVMFVAPLAAAFGAFWLFGPWSLPLLAATAAVVAVAESAAAALVVFAWGRAGGGARR